MTTSTYQTAFEKYRPAALTLSTSEVEPCRANVRVAAANVRLSFESVFGDPAKDPKDHAARVAKIKKALPQLDHDAMLDGPVLARAVVFASLALVRRPLSPGEVQKHVDVIAAPREQMLTIGETLAARGLLPRDKVAEIRAGNGKLDMASDVVALVAMYREHADKVNGAHPFTEAEFATVLPSAEWLLDHLTPTGARPGKPADKAEQQDTLDRLWTLLTRVQAQFRQAGFWLFGDDLEQYTPKLQSRIPGTSIDEPEAEIAEAATEPQPA